MKKNKQKKTNGKTKEKAANAYWAIRLGMWNNLGLKINTIFWYMR